jgi:hypothetical protein
MGVEKNLKNNFRPSRNYWNGSKPNFTSSVKKSLKKEFIFKDKFFFFKCAEEGVFILFLVLNETKRHDLPVLKFDCKILMSLLSIPSLPKLNSFPFPIN